MATPDQIADVIELLIESTVNPDLTERQLNLMNQSWRDVDSAVLEAAAVRHINRSQFFPRLAEMNGLIREERDARRANFTVLPDDDLAHELREFERIQKEMDEQSTWATCSPCAGAGYVVRMPTGELVTLTYWRFLTGRAVPMGDPTPDCLWEMCAPCRGIGKARPEASETLNAAMTQAHVGEFDEVRSA